MDFPKGVPGVGLVNGLFVDEDSAIGRPGSLIPAGWGNAVTQEILNVVAGAGLDPEEGNNAQLLEAIKELINAPVATLEARHKAMGDGNSYSDVTGIRLENTVYTNPPGARMRRIRITAVATVADGYLGITVNPGLPSAVSKHQFIPIVGWSSSCECDIWPGQTYLFSSALATVTKVEETQ